MHQSHATASELRHPDLDGLRGWASLSVVLFHIFWEIFGVLVPAFRNPVTAALFNGQMAVSIFFVLSGEALSVRYWTTADRQQVVRQCIRRYPRLTIPIFFSCLAVLVLWTLDLCQSREAAALVGRANWLGQWLTFEPDIVAFLRYVLFDVYVAHTAETSFNPFLWTMATELAGSFIVFAALLVERHLPPKILAALLVSTVAAIGSSFIGCFVAGMLFGRLRANGYFLRQQQGCWNPVSNFAVLAIVAALTALLQLIGAQRDLPYAATAIALVFTIHGNGAVTRFLANPVSHFLGRHSFPLYLVHFPVIISLTSGAIVYAHGHDSLTAPWIVAIGLMSVAASLAAAMAFAPVERLTRRVCALLP